MSCPWRFPLRSRARISAAVAAVTACLVAAILGAGAGFAEGAFPPAENGKIAFTGDGQLFVMEPDGSNRGSLLVTKPVVGATAFSPDGQRILYANSDIFSPEQTQGIWSTDARALGDVVRLVPGVTQGHDLSPDGTKLVYSQNRPPGPQIYLANADGSDPVSLTSGAGFTIVYDPTFSPDGSRIAFSGDRDIFVMNADGSNPVNLTGGAVTAATPEFSPDGSKILFTACLPPCSPGQAQFDIFVMNADGSNPVNLTNTSDANEGDGVFSPDGTKIAFAGDRDSIYGDIFVMNADGSNPVNLTRGAVVSSDFPPVYPAWGRAVAGGDDCQLAKKKLKKAKKKLKKADTPEEKQKAKKKLKKAKKRKKEACG